MRSRPGQRPPSPGPAGTLERGIALFNTGSYFEAHEEFEDLWRAATGPERPLYQGLAQACAGLVKHQRSEPRSALTLLDKALGKLRAAPEGCLPELRLADLIAQLQAARDALDSGASFTPPAMRRPGDV
jgi:predicted metal-dependent hydrolase